MSASHSRPHPGATRRLPSGRWQARLRDPSTNELQAIGTFTTKADAIKALSLAVADQVRGDWVSPERSAITVADWSERWWQTTGALRPNTRTVYRHMLDRHILPSLGRRPLGDIDTLTVRTWLAGLASSGVGPASRAKAYRVLSRVMATAVEAGRLARNPCTLRGAASEPTLEMRCPTPEQIVAIANEVPHRYRALVLLAGFGGLRWGELVALRRHRVDLLHRVVNVVDAVSEVNASHHQVGRPKTDAGVRTVALPKLVVDALEAHLAEFSEPGRTGLVFPAPDGGYLRRSNFRQRVWLPAVARADADGLRFHDLRHGAATMAAQAGATTRELMSRIGHASPAAALRYQHVSAGRDAAIAERLDALVTTAPAPSKRRSARR